MLFRSGYARKLRKGEIQSNPENWYIPHFPVYNVNKPGKIRMVFDAAAQSSGISLNCALIPDPDLLTSLVAVIFKFRQREIGFGGYIQEMFHRVQIRDEDVPAQRFFWRNGNSFVDLEVYEMKAMIFGKN